MPTRRTYNYQPTDNPLTVAEQFGTTPQQLISANPGGYPFSTGQTINVPYQAYNLPNQGYTTPFTPQTVAAVQNQYAPPKTTPRPATGVAGLAQQIRGKQDSLFNPLVGGGQSQPGGPANAERQVWENEIEGALNSGTPPAILSPFAAQSLGIDPQKNGYIMQGGQWVYNAAYAQAQAAGGTTPSTTPGGEGGGQQQNIDPRNISYTWNKYAKNPKSRFQTNLKWAQNAMRRKAGKGKNQQNQQQNAPVQQDASITGFGLVNFSAGSG